MSTTTQRLTEKVAVITGANSGIGFATAKRFVDEGARVVITGRRQEALDKAVAELGERAIGVQGDVSNLKDLDKLFSVVKEKYGRIDVLFANAGIAEFAPVDAATEDHYDRTFDINVKGLFFTVQKALPLIQDGGSIILNASVVQIKGFANSSVYSASKAAVRSFARTWATDLKDRKIRVNAISPGPVETPIFEKTGMPAEQMDEMAAGFASLIPLARFGQPDEIANSAVFLASADSSFVNGIDLQVDGGMSQV